MNKHIPENVMILNDKGMIWCLVIRPTKAEDRKYDKTGRGIVSFYDCRYDHTNLGQLVSSYYVETLLLELLIQYLDERRGEK